MEWFVAGTLFSHLSLIPLFLLNLAVIFTNQKIVRISVRDTLDHKVIHNTAPLITLC